MGPESPSPPIPKEPFRAAEEKNNSSVILRRTLLLLLLFGTTLLITITPLIDPDLWWHLRAGKWILEEGALPLSDPFSIGGPQKPWQAYSWLFEVMIYSIFDQGGLVGLVCFKALMALLITGTLYLLFRRLTEDFSLSIGLTVLVFLILQEFFTPRPWLFTLLFFLVELHLILRALGGGSRWLLFLPPLFWVWANLHIQFIYGLFLLFALILDGLWCRRKALSLPPLLPLKNLVIISGASFLATLITPYHLELYSVIWKYANQWKIYKYVQELAPLKFDNLFDWTVVSLALVPAWYLGWRKEKRLLPYLLLLGATFQGLRMGRDAWFLAIIGGSILLGFPSLPSPERKFSFSPFQRLFIGLAVLVSFFLIFLGRGYTSEERLIREMEDRFPVKAVQFLQKQNQPGPLFNNFSWGGYLMWHLPQYPVAIDGRTNVYGAEKVERNMLTWYGSPNWEKDPLLQRARLVVGTVKLPLSTILLSDRRFKLIYRDRGTLVFVRVFPLRKGHPK